MPTASLMFCVSEMFKRGGYQDALHFFDMQTDLGELCLVIWSPYSEPADESILSDSVHIIYAFFSVYKQCGVTEVGNKLGKSAQERSLLEELKQVSVKTF